MGDIDTREHLLAARLWSATDRADECWIYTGRCDGSGYGILSVAGRDHRAHRVAYELEVGPIPVGLVLDHLCRVRNCVNPAHLEPVTNRENILRGVGLAAVNARKTHCPKGHPYAGENVRVSVQRDGRVRRTCRQCVRDSYVPRRPQQQCFRGHSLVDPDNVYVNPSGARVCKTCRRIWKKNRRVALR